MTSQMTPEWLLQVIWYGAGVGGTGAIWYFLSQKSYHTALWTGFTTVVVVLLAVALHIRNDLLRREQQTALQEKLPAEKETLIATSPPVSTGQDVALRQVSPDLTSDESTPAPQRPTIREKSAGEILDNLKDITSSYRLDEKVKELYFGRWTRAPGWQATVCGLPSKLTGGGWLCSLKEVGSDTMVYATTPQDISALRPGDSVSVSGRIRDVKRFLGVTLEDVILRGENVPFR